MIGQAGILNVLVTASTGQANAALAKTSAQFRGTAGAAESSAVATSRAWRGVGVGLGLVGIAAVKLSTDFNKSMTMIETQAGAPRGEIDKLKNSVLDLAKKSVFAPQQLADSLFHVESVGYRGAKAMHALNVSQKLATIGGSDLESTTYGVVSALESGIKGTQNMGKAVGIMNAIVGHGDMRMQDFTAALSTGLLPVADNFGLSLRDVGSALDTMTARGTPAQAAATRLRMTFSLLGAQSATAEKELGKLGIKQGELGEIMQRKGLIPALADLKSHLANAGDAAARAQVMTAAFGGGRTSAGITTLVNNLGDVRDRFKGIGDTSNQFNQDFRQASNTTAAQFARAWSTIQADLIHLGDTLAGPAATAATIFAKAIDLIPTALDHIPDSIKTVMLSLLALRITWAFIGGTIGKLMGAGIISGLLATEMGVSAQVFAMRFMEATGGALPLAVAAVGIGNIVMKAIQGDTKGAALSGMGAVVGGAIGAAIGGGLPGALVGAGIGSIAGNFFTSIFGGSKVRKGIHQGLDAAMKGQSKAFAHFDDTGKRLSKARQREVDTAQKARKAEQHYQNVLKNHGKNSLPAIRAEHQLQKATMRHTRAVQADRRAERAHGLARKLATRESQQALNEAQREMHFERKRANSLQDTIRTQHKQGTTFKELQPKIDKWNTANKRARHAQDDWNKAMKKSVDELGPKTTKQLAKQARDVGRTKAGVDHFAKSLKVLTTNSSHYDAQAREMNKMNGQMGGTWSKVFKQLDNGSKTIRGAAQELYNASQKSSKGTDDATRSTQHFGKEARDQTPNVRKLGDVTQYTTKKTVELQDKTGHAVVVLKNDVQNWTKVSRGNIGDYEQALNKAITAMGLNPVNFKAGTVPTGKEHGGGGGKHHQKGGFFNVPGTGSGDTVPLHVGGQLAAYVEPGELVGVINRTAAGVVNGINGAIPRAQRGAVIDMPGVNMSVGSEPIIKKDLGKFSMLEGKPVYVISGFRTPAHSVAVGGFANDPHTQGAAADIGLGSPTLASMMSLALENPLNRVGLHRPYYPPSTSEANHVELLGGGARGAAITAALPHIGFAQMFGPAGAFLNLGNAGSHKMQNAANQYIQKHAPTMGGLLGNVPTGPVVEMAKKMVTQVFGAGQWPPFQSLEMQEAGFNPRALNASSGAAGLAQALPPSKYPPGAWPYTGPESAKLQLQWMMGYIKDRYGNPAGAWAHEQSAGWYKHGGVLDLAKGGKLHIGKTLRRIGKAGKATKQHQILHQWIDKAKKLGLPEHLLKKVGKYDSDFQTYDELAQRAADITGDSGVPAQVPGPGGTHDQAGWLHKELDALWQLRKYMIMAQERIKKLRKMIKKQLDLAQHRYRDLKKQQRQTETQIKSLRKKRDLSKSDLADIRDKQKSAAKRIKQLQGKKKLTNKEQNELSTLKSANRLRDKLLSDKKMPASKRLKNAMDSLQADHHAQSVRMDALHGTPGIISVLKDRSGKLGGSLSNFTALDEIQGRGTTKVLHTHLASPVDPRFGGDILDVQLQLRDLGAAGGALSGLNVSDLAEFAKLVRAGAFNTDAFGTVPTFHKGGMVRLPGGTSEVISKLKQGEGVIDARTMQRGLGNGDVNVSVTMYADEERALVDVNGEQFKVAVNKVHKKAEKERAHRTYRQQRAGARLTR